MLKASVPPQRICPSLRALGQQDHVVSAGMAFRFRQVLKLFLLSAGSIALAGCAFEKGSVLNPGGPVAYEMQELLYFVGIVMLLILIPVYGLTAYYGWKYRASNKNADYEPSWDFSKPITIATLGGPALIILLFAVVLTKYTYQLDPFRPLDNPNKPLEIQAIAVDWKWIFVYPEENIVTVNEIKFPVNRPVSFRITSDTVMNSFMVQGLAGQIYAMAGMESKLHLLADRAGNYEGRNMQFTGDGYAAQTFMATATSDAEYQKWVAHIRTTTAPLTDADYKELAKPKGNTGVLYFSAGGAGVFDNVIRKYAEGRQGAIVAPATKP